MRPLQTNTHTHLLTHKHTDGECIVNGVPESFQTETMRVRIRAWVALDDVDLIRETTLPPPSSSFFCGKVRQGRSVCGAYRGRRLGRHCHAAGGGRTTSTTTKAGTSPSAAQLAGCAQTSGYSERCGLASDFIRHVVNPHHTGQAMDSTWRICEKCLQSEARICLMRHLCYHASLGSYAPNLDPIPGSGCPCKIMQPL